jgi:predicted dehydrogenase
MSLSPLRFAVVGLGHISQVAVLPAFAHAKSSARLTALVSDDPLKRRLLGRQYGSRPHLCLQRLRTVFAKRRD